MYFVLLSTFVRMVLGMDPVVEDLLTPSKELGEACGYEGCPYVKEGMLNVHIVPHTHGELGYTRTFYEHYTGHDDHFDKSNINMKRILDYTISELWAQEHRKFTLSDTAYLFHWWANRDSTVHRMVYQLLRQGRLHIVGGGWSMPDEACTSYHALIDQYTFSLRKLNSTFSTCGRPLVAWQADVFGHSREFTALSALLAFDGLFVNPISFEDELARMRNKELEMLWRGSDDLGPETDIFTHKLFDGYWSPPGFCFGSMCNDPLLISSDSQFKNIEERVNLFIESVKNRQAPHYATNHIMVVMGQRFGYHDASIWFENIDKLIAKVNEKSYSSGERVHLTYSAPACYLKAVHDSNPTLPIKQDDFMSLTYDKKTHFTGLFTSRPTIKFMAREGHVYLQMAKQLQVLAALPNHDKLFAEFNWIMGVFQDHNIITGAMRPHVKNYYTHKMYYAIQKSTIILKKAFNKLRESPSSTVYYRCAFNVSSCKNTNAVRSFIVIYNPLAWPVTIPVRVPIVRNSRYNVLNPKLQPVDSVMMKIPDSVLSIPSRDTVADHEIVFMAVNLPPMGYRSYYIESSKIADQKKRRSIIKKLRKNKKKKYLTRQTDNLKIDDESLLDNNDYVYYDDPTTSSPLDLGNETVEMNEADLPYISPPKVMSRSDLDIIETETDVPETRHDKFLPKSPGTNISTTNTAPNEKHSTPGKRLQQNPYSIQDIKYFYRVSKDNFIGNKYINLKLDKRNQVTNVSLSNGVQMALTIQLLYYASDDPNKMGRPDEKKPGPYIFKLMDPVPVLIEDYIKSVVHKSYLVEEVHNSFADWAAFNVRVYEERPIIEVDWVVGPIPVEDGIGKDIFIRYTTDLANEGVFFTDSNGRQTVKRVRNDRPMYEPVYPDAIPGNFYPVTSKIYIEDANKNIRFSVLNDRAQGGTSLYEGVIDVTVNRRILTDDSGVQTFLNDTEAGKGIVVRGKHYLYISKANYKPNKIFEKKLAKEIELAPQIFASPFNAYGDNSKEIWYGQTNEYSGINDKLPMGVHVLTLQEWSKGTFLLRLENYLEKTDIVKSGIKTVFIKKLFTNIVIKNARETTLGANIWMKDWLPLRWNAKEKYVRSFNEFYRGNGSVIYSNDSINEYEEVDINKGVKLTPQQIRTFVVSFDFLNKEKSDYTKT